MHSKHTLAAALILIVAASGLGVGVTSVTPASAEAAQGDHNVEAFLRVATHHSKRPARGSGKNRKRSGAPFKVREATREELNILSKQFDQTVPDTLQDNNIFALEREKTPGAGLTLDKYLIVPKDPKLHPPRLVTLAEDLYKTAYDSVTAPAPAPATNPATNAKNPPIVALPVWFWANGAQPVTATAAAAGYTMTVTATPRAVRWTASDKTSTFCNHLGMPWAPGVSEQGACTYTYDRAIQGETAEVSMGWTVTSTFTAPGGGELPNPAPPVASFATWADVNFDVFERHAVSN